MSEMLLSGHSLDPDAGGRGVHQLPITPEQLQPVAHDLATTHGARVADLFGTLEPDDTVTLRLVFARDESHDYVIVETQVSDEIYPAMADIVPAAFVEECELYEQFGIRPANGKPLNRVALPPGPVNGFARLGHPPRVPPREVHAPHSVAGHAFEFPVGPVRANAVESLYTGLVTSGEEVVDLYLFTWHKHRGVERRLAGLDVERALFLIERVEGLGAIGNGWAFCHAVEAAAGASVPPGAAASRAVALELERLYNHAAAIAALAASTGLSVGQAQAEIALEELLRVNAAVFGHRYLFGVLAPGGVSRAPDIDALRRLLTPAWDELRRVANALLASNSFVDRLEATGIVTTPAAGRLGLVGPLARASGVPVDARIDHPVPPYTQIGPAPVSRTSGDVLARMQVMLAEATESKRLIDEMVATAPAADRARVPDAAGAALGWAESSRGEALAWVQRDPSGRIARCRIRPASARNWRAFDDAARSQNVFTDIPIIEASFWLTVAGMAR